VFKDTPQKELKSTDYPAVIVTSDYATDSLSIDATRRSPIELSFSIEVWANTLSHKCLITDGLMVLFNSKDSADKADLDGKSVKQNRMRINSVDVLDEDVYTASPNISYRNLVTVGMTYSGT
jgi:hypothetical protein